MNVWHTFARVRAPAVTGPPHFIYSIVLGGMVLWPSKEEDHNEAITAA